MNPVFSAATLIVYLKASVAGESPRFTFLDIVGLEERELRVLSQHSLHVCGMLDSRTFIFKKTQFRLYLRGPVSI